MNLYEYKKMVMKDIEEFFRGVYFNNVGIKNKKIVGYLTPECSDFFNKSGMVRSVTEELLKKIISLKEELFSTNIEFASSKEEVDYYVRIFVDDVRKEVDNYRNLIIRIMFQVDKDNISMTELQEVKEKNTINTGLNFIKIKIGNNLYLASKTSADVQEESAISEHINDFLIIIYLLIDMIKDKKRRKEYLIDLNSSTFKVEDPRYNEMLIMITKNYLNIKDYEIYVNECDDIEEQILTGLTNATLIGQITNMINSTGGVMNNEQEYFELVLYAKRAIQSKKYLEIKDAYSKLIKYLSEKETKVKGK